MSSGPSHLQPWVSDPSDHVDIHLRSGTRCLQCGRAILSHPFGTCLVSVPSPKCLAMGAALGEMARQPTHETLLLLPLELAHSLGQAHIIATHHFYFGLGVLPHYQVRQRQPLFLQGCHLACQCNIVPVFVPICLGVGGILACTHWLSCFLLLSKHV